MADNSTIEWTDATWNPVTGCVEVSPGCDNCYAKTFAERWRGTPGHHFEKGFDLVLRPERLDEPLKWKKPRKVFVNSMSDLFHADIPDEYIAKVFAVMAATPQHTYQVLTKRHGRMRSLLNKDSFRDNLLSLVPGATWPLPNLWLGVSVEDQQWANLRIPALLQTPAAVRWLSMEPLLGPVDLRFRPTSQQVAEIAGQEGIDSPAYRRALSCHLVSCLHGDHANGIDWVVVGGESGHGARPMHPNWARSLRDQCASAGVPYFYKQHGVWAEADRDSTHLLQMDGKLVDRKDATTDHPYGYGSGIGQDLVDRGHQGWVRVRRINKKAAGRLLDGREWNEFPEARP